MKRKKDQMALHLMMLPGMILLAIFSFTPMFGIIMAFQNYMPARGIAKSPWVGMDNFIFMFQMPDSKQIFINTITIAVGKINAVLEMLGIEPILFMASNKWFRSVLIVTDVWKGFGYGAIIYLAALSGIDPGLYEAAAIDGANRFKRVWHITLPGILPTIMLVTIMNLPNVLNAGFDQIFNLYNPLVMETADIIDTWVYRVGLVERQYSLGTAVGLLRSIVGIILMLSANKIAQKVTDYRIF